MGNFGYGVLIFALLAFLLGGVAYLSGRQDECARRGATLVRVPLGIGWKCVKEITP